MSNFLSPVEFRVTINRLKDISFTVQKASIPSITGSPVEMPTPFNKHYLTNDKIQYSNLDFTFLVDEDMGNYLSIINWMKGVGFDAQFSQFDEQNKSENGLYSDISMLIYNSSRNASVKVDYINCFPVSLSEISMDITQQDVVYSESTVSFQYDRFDVTKL